MFYIIETVQLTSNILIAVPILSFGQDISGLISENSIITSIDHATDDTLKASAQADGTLSLKSENEHNSIISFNLRKNYPNPFNPETSISFTIDRKDQISLKIYDISGKLTQVLVDKLADLGTYQFTWRPPTSLPSGVYFYRINANNFSDVKQMLLVK